MVMVVHLPGEFSRGKGQKEQRRGGRRRAETKVFAARKKFWRRAFHPSDDDPTVLQAALRVRTHGGWPHRGNRMHTPDTSERRGAIRATASAGAVKAFRTARPEKPQPLTFAIRP
ncbi:hypothetical protein ABF73_19330 [Enterobacter roggenkampii]|nr:hypothetical protein ABF73_19330 [Enterobacter roggenkampii]